MLEKSEGEIYARQQFRLFFACLVGNNLHVITHARESSEFFGMR